MLPSHTADAATAELERVAELGLRGVLVGCFEADVPPFRDEWERFWTVAGELGVPVHFHLGTGFHSLRTQLGIWEQPAAVAVSPMQLDELLAGMLFSGMFERHPGSRLVLGESGLGWVPYVVERLDHEYRKYHHLVRDRLSRPPGETFAEQVFLTFEEDELGLSTTRTATAPGRTRGA